MDSYTTSWLSFIGALQDVYGVPLVLLVLEVKLEENLEEDPYENPTNGEDVPTHFALAIESGGSPLITITKYVVRR